jgi:pimeloyl-ACP methyl ester carboxylesterase
MTGSGPALLLVHGLGATRATWDRVVDTLSARFTVIAPDLPGHGESDPPAGDYSLGAHAAAMRDLLVALGHTHASVVGHSLGGGVALQFAYQFPDRVSRLMLLSSGGLGAELTPMLRAATVPGAPWVVSGMGRVPAPVTRSVLTALARWPGAIASCDVPPVLEGIRGFADAGRRQAFLGSARAVISWRGQTVSALRQIGLLADLPVLVAWGSQDRTIPPRHHRSVAELLPSATFLEVDGAGHYPHETHVGSLLPHLVRFLASTEPFVYDEARWRHRLTTAPSSGRS